MFERKKRERGSLKPLLRYYMLKLVRNDGTPEYIARGVALRLAVGFVIPMFFQLAVAIPLSFLLRAAKVPAIAFTFVSNHFTVFLIYPVQCWIGSYLIMRPLTYRELEMKLKDVVADPSWATFSALGVDLGLAFLAGGVLFALLAAVPGYFLTVRLVKRYRAARERRRLKKAEEKKL